MRKGSEREWYMHHVLHSYVSRRLTCRRLCPCHRHLLLLDSVYTQKQESKQELSTWCVTAHCTTRHRISLSRTVSASDRGGSGGGSRLSLGSAVSLALLEVVDADPILLTLLPL